jgi:VanZ family protein
MKYISVLFLVFIIAIIVLVDNGSLPHWIRVIYDFPNGDKLGHFILYGLLDFFITRAVFLSFPSKPRGWVTLSIGLTLAVFVDLEEWSQQFFPTRTFDLVDLMASYLGLFVGGLAAYKIKRQ